MRALSVITSIVDDAMWVLTVIAFGLLLFAPTIVMQPMPFYTGTVQQFLIDWRFEAVMVLVFFSMLSGRWPTQGMRIFDRRLVLVCALVLSAFCLAVFAWHDITRGTDLVRADLPLGLKKDLLVVTGFAWLSFFALKAEGFMATSLKSGAATGEQTAAFRTSSLGDQLTGGQPITVDARVRFTEMQLPGRPWVRIPPPGETIEHSVNG